MQTNILCSCPEFYSISCFSTSIFKCCFISYCQSAIFSSEVRETSLENCKKNKIMVVIFLLLLCSPFLKLSVIYNQILARQCIGILLNIVHYLMVRRFSDGSQTAVESKYDHSLKLHSKLVILLMVHSSSR